MKKLPSFVPSAAGADVASDGNLYWSLSADAKQAETLFKKYQASPEFTTGKELYAAGSTTHNVVADPHFASFSSEPFALNDYHLKEGSAAINAGVAIPAEWPDPLREGDAGKPDIGAFPLTVEPVKIGK
jgi:hypothetical protein